MLISHFVTFIFAASSLSCLASAFSTLFMTERVGEATKNQEVEEIKPQKMGENNVVETKPSVQAVGIEVIPIVADVFAQTDEDLLNMTPLKLVTAIAAQHLITTMKNMPDSNSIQDTVNMFSDIVKEFNKTAQIIKLTAEYVNISGHYILSSMDQLSKTSCEKEAVEEAVKTLKKKFFNTITVHVTRAIKELNEKTRQREMTGSDILVSSSYHIVNAFQEMTNQVLNVVTESTKKCSKSVPKIEVIPTSEEQMNATEIKNGNHIFTVELVPEQGKSHKSIKKDQANPINENKAKQTDLENFQDQLTVENFNGNQDLTVEVFSPEAFIRNKSPALENKDDDKLKVEFFPLKTIKLFENTNIDKLKHSHEEFDGTKQGIPQNKKNADKELASSAVDSLSNVPSGEFQEKEPDKTTVFKNIEKAPEATNTDQTVLVKNVQKTSPKMLNLWDLVAPGFQRPQYQPVQCDEHVEPVCGVDKRNKKFIIFLNDCKREVHNRMYGTNYNWFSMETCVGMFLRNSTLGAQDPSTNLHVNNVDLRPR